MCLHCTVGASIGFCSMRAAVAYCARDSRAAATCAVLTAHLWTLLTAALSPYLHRSAGLSSWYVQCMWTDGRRWSRHDGSPSVSSGMQKKKKKKKKKKKTEKKEKVATHGTTRRLFALLLLSASTAGSFNGARQRCAHFVARLLSTPTESTTSNAALSGGAVCVSSFGRAHSRRAL